jgi:hypothetical protein
MEPTYFTDSFRSLSENLLTVDFYFMLLIIAAFVITALLNFLRMVANDIF